MWLAIILVPTVNIPKPRWFKVVFVNRIKMLSVPGIYQKQIILLPYQTGHTRSRIKTFRNERSGTKTSCTHVLCDYVICFNPPRKTHSSLYIGTAFSFLYVECDQRENPVQRRNHRGKQAWRSRWTGKRGPKPLEKPRGAANLQSSQKIEISRACETKITRMRSLVLRERKQHIVV